MLKIAVVIWIVMATTLAGLALLVVVTVPSLAADASRLIPIACSAATVVAMPLSYLVAWRISRVGAA